MQTIARYSSRIVSPAILPARQHRLYRTVERQVIRPGTQHASDMVSFQLKVPKGTKDWDGKDMVIREKIFSTITNVFKRHGAVTIDTYASNSP